MRKEQTVLGFDFGLKHIGVAIGQTITLQAKPLTTLRAKEGIPNWDEIHLLLKNWRPQFLLVGYPLNMDDSENEMCQRAKKFANRLHGRFGLPVEMIDERLTSWEAKQNLADAYSLKGHSEAAALIVQQWLRETFPEDDI